MKKVIPVLAIAILAAGSLFYWKLGASATAKASFPDIADSPYQTAITALYNDGLVSGYANGQFKPNLPVDRAQMAALLVKLADYLGLVTGNQQGKPAFGDVSPSAWYAGSVDTAWNHGWIKGLSPFVFGPDQPVTEVQAATMLINLWGRGAEAETLGGWPGGYIRVADQDGLTKGLDFVPGNDATRGMVAGIMYNALSYFHNTPLQAAQDYLAGRPAHTGGYSLADLTRAFDFDPLYRLGYYGQGQTVAIVVHGVDPGEIHKDMDKFDKMYNLPKPDIKYVYPNGANYTSVPFAQSEEPVLDVSMVHAFAPRAKIIVVADSYPLGAFQYILKNKTASIITYSANGPESDYSSTGIAAWEKVLKSLAQSGVTILKGSGDWSATDKSGHFNGTAREWASRLPAQYNVNFPSSSPWVTALGGTVLFPDASGGYGAEVGWARSGGGYSSLFARPSWQQNAGLGADEKMRAVPDAAFDAGAISALPIVFEGQVRSGGGDSASGPAWAAIMALADQVAGRPLGFINPSLYMIANSDYYGLAFHDVRMGSNGYPAAANWDPVTGLGSPNVYYLVKFLAVGYHGTVPAAISGSQSEPGTG
ncbi:MAG: S-layer homology domain-containing protein [Peptococcaceae bacterium]|nr:S-layer homology domain-containing protein [Peptococcaceae bacterium]